MGAIFIVLFFIVAGIITLVMMVVPIVLIVVLVKAGIKNSEKQKQSWQRIAAKYGLKYMPGGSMGAPKMSGTIAGRRFTLTSVTEGTSDHRHYYTKFQILFKDMLDCNMQMCTQTFAQNIATTFGAQDLKIGDTRFDSAVVIKGKDIRIIKTYLTKPRKEAILQAVARYPGFYIDDEGITIKIAGILNSEQFLSSHIEYLRKLVVRMEDQPKESHQVAAAEQKPPKPVPPTPTPDKEAETVPPPIPETTQPAADSDTPTKAAKEDTVTEEAPESEKPAAEATETKTEPSTSGKEETVATTPAEPEEQEGALAKQEAPFETITLTPDGQKDEPTPEPAVDKAPDGQTAEGPAPSQPEQEEEPTKEKTIEPADAMENTDDAETPKETPVPPENDSELVAAEVATKLFQDSPASFELESRFKEFSGQTVKWQATVKYVQQYSSDIVFGDTPGTKVTLELCQIEGSYGMKEQVKAIASFPESKYKELQKLTGETMAVRGTLLKAEGISREIFINNAETAD